MITHKSYGEKIGFARPRFIHQLLLKRLLNNIDAECATHGLIAVGEAAITDNLNDFAPDVAVFDKKRNPLVVIELTRHNSLNYDFNKCEKLLARYPNLECFICDIERSVVYFTSGNMDSWEVSEVFLPMSMYFSNPIDHYFADPYGRDNAITLHDAIKALKEQFE